MGRNKIKIEYIKHTQNRKVTFRKRWNGLKRKIKQLSILSGCEVLVVVKPLGASSDPALFLELCSRQPAEAMVLEYLQAHQEGQVQRVSFDEIQEDDDDTTPSLPPPSPLPPLVMANAPSTDFATFPNTMPLLYHPPAVQNMYPDYASPFFVGQW